MAGLAFRRRFHGDGVVFYLMIGSLVAPGLVLSLGIGLFFHLVGISPTWYTSAVARNCPGRFRSVSWSCSQ